MQVSDLIDLIGTFNTFQHLSRGSLLDVTLEYTGGDNWILWARKPSELERAVFAQWNSTEQASAAMIRKVGQLG